MFNDFFGRVAVLGAIRNLMRRARKIYKRSNPEGKPLDRIAGELFVKRYPKHVDVVETAIRAAKEANPNITDREIGLVAIVRLIQHVA